MQYTKSTPIAQICQLPTEYRIRALGNALRLRGEEFLSRPRHFQRYHEVSEVLRISFIWKDTQEGHEYWSDLYEQIHRAETEQKPAAQYAETVTQ